MKKILTVPYFLFCIFHFSFSQNVEVYPSNWWVGMKNPKLQLMLHGENVGMFTKVAINYAGVKVDKISKVEGKNYLFVDLTISKTTKPGKFKILMSGGNLGNEDIFFELKPRRLGNGTAFAQGVTSKDFVYLLMPDRFSNGDPSNDRVEGMRDQSLNRDNVFDRHGGDLQGVINHLDYLNDLGVTTVWMTPVLTNHYHIEPRLGERKRIKN